MSAIIIAVGIALAAVLVVMFVPRMQGKSRWKPDRREIRQRQEQIAKILDAHGRCAVDEAVSSAVHDLNNLLLVLSMEATRLSSVRADEENLRTTIATLNQMVDEGRQVVDELTAQALDNAETSETCDMVKECQMIATFWGSISGAAPHVEIALDAQHLPFISAQAREFRLLALELCRVATDFALASEDGAAISIGNGGRGEARLSVVCNNRVAEPTNHARLSGIRSLTERVSGDYGSHSDGNESCTIVLNIPALTT